MRTKKEILKTYLELLNDEKNLGYSSEDIDKRLSNKIEYDALNKLLVEEIYSTEIIKGWDVSSLRAFEIYCKCVIHRDTKTGDEVWNSFLEKQFLLVEHNKFSCYMAARGHGKTFFVALYCVFKMFLHSSFDIGYCSNIPRQRRRFLKTFRTLIDTNELLIEKKDIRGIANKSKPWGTEEAEYNHGILEGTTVGTTPRGGHYAHAFADDPLRDDQKYTYEYIVNYFQGVFRQCIGRKKGRYTIVGTPQDIDDLFHTLMNDKLDKNGRPIGKVVVGKLSASGFYCEIFPGILDDKKKTVLVPEIWDYDELLAERDRIGDIRFNREILCRCITYRNALIGSHLFRSCCDEKLSMIQKGEKSEGGKDKKYVIFVDSATSDAPTADFCAISIFEDDELNNKFILRHLFHEKGYPLIDPDGGIEDQPHVLYKLYKDFNNALIAVEKNNAGISLIQSMNAMGVDVIEHFTHQISTGKVSKNPGKADDVVDYIEQGLKKGVVVFPSNPEDIYTLDMLEKVRNEHLNFGVKKGKSGEIFEALAGKDDIFDSCFPKGHLVKTSQGYKDISKIKEGDYVLTHKNRYKKVVKKMKRFIDEDIYELDINGIPERIQCTKEHPFYVTTMDKLKGIKYKKNKNNFYDKFEWIAAKDLKEMKRKSRHLLDMGISNINNNLINYSTEIKKVFSDLKGFERFVGLYLAEGSCSHHGIALAFNKNEIEYINFCLNFLRKNDYSANTQIVGNCCRVYSQTKSLKDFFSNFGKSINKKIPSYTNDIFGLDTVKGWFEGDGHLDKNETIKCSSISKELIYQMRDILMFNGIVSNIYIDYRKHGNCFKNSKPIYVLTMNKYNSSRFLFGEDPKRHDTGIFFYDGRFLTGFKKSIIQFKGYVYNLSVEDDESYVIEGVKVHNCWGAFKYRGDMVDTLPLGFTYPGQ